MQIQYEAVIGLEVHIQLCTKTKMFCSCLNEYGKEPNTNICPVCLSLPGVLPIVNDEAIRMAIMIGLATNGKINTRSKFYRKHYFYPDLPKGYQITQGPIALIEDGYITINSQSNNEKDYKTTIVKIDRIHIEEDTGKLNHEIVKNQTCIDFNRAGIPLIEIVSAPNLKNGQEAYEYLKTLHHLVTYLGICNGNLEEGSFRCDANISVNQINNKRGTRVEIKNINSFRFVQMAIDYEIKRQTAILKIGQQVYQETRGWDSEKQITKSQRNKEMAMDYCYFPEPNLQDIIITQEEIDIIKKNLPELPQDKFNRFMKQYNLTKYEVNLLIHDANFANFFENVAKQCSGKEASKWMLGEISRNINSTNGNINDLGITATDLAELILLIDKDIINLKTAKEIVFPIMLAKHKTPKTIIAELDLKQISDTSHIRTLILETINAHPIQLEQYYNGKKNVKDFFIGQIIKANRGKINPTLVRNLIEDILTNNCQ